MDTKLAIIIPTYDSLDTLKTLVRQVFEYTTGNFRLYIVEDGQKEETIEFLKGLDATVIYHEVNKGVAPSWNDGLRAALSDDCTHFAILNDDIELVEGWFEACLPLFNKKVHLVCLDAPCPTPLTGWFFILDRACIEKVGLFDEQFAPYCAEDDDYYIRYRKDGFILAKANLEIPHHSSATLRKISRDVYRSVVLENWNKLRRKYPNLKLRARV